MLSAGAFYLRLVGRPVEVYKYLEPLYNDYRKIRLRHADGSFGLSHMDEVVDELLNKEYLFDIAMPRIPNRWGLSCAHTCAAQKPHTEIHCIATAIVRLKCLSVRGLQHLYRATCAYGQGNNGEDVSAGAKDQRPGG